MFNGSRPEGIASGKDHRVALIHEILCHLGDAGRCFGPNVYHNGAPRDPNVVQYTYFDEWIGLVDEFVACVRGGRQPQINLRWHRPTIEAMNACYESIASGRPVRLPAPQASAE